MRAPYCQIPTIGNRRCDKIKVKLHTNGDRTQQKVIGNNKSMYA